MLMKFDVWEDIMSLSSYFKPQPDLVKGKLGGGGVEPKISENAYEWRDQDETWWGE